MTYQKNPDLDVISAEPSFQDEMRRATGLRGMSLVEQEEALRPTSSGPLDAPAPTVAAQVAQHIEEAIASGERMLDDLAGWADFVVTAAGNVEFEGMWDRAEQIAAVITTIQEGGELERLGISPDDHRLRNVAAMQEVLRAKRGGGTGENRLAADGIRDANAAFYVLMGNNAGRFDGIDMGRYREIGAMHVAEAARALPDFEAELFAGQTDGATVDFGNSLPPSHREWLFMTYNRARDLVDYGGHTLDRLGQAASDAGDWLSDALGFE